MNNIISTFIIIMLIGFVAINNNNYNIIVNLDEQNTILNLTNKLYLIENANLHNQTDHLSNRIYNLHDNITKLNNDLSSYKSVLTEQVQRYDNNFKINMNPTLKEVKEFIKNDKTDRNKWIKSVYDCTQFSNEVIRNAKFKGLYSCSVELNYDTTGDGVSDSGHMIVVFNTSDEGLIYIEPQSDKLVDMAVGMNYAPYLNYDNKYIVIEYDNCFERMI